LAEDLLGAYVWGRYDTVTLPAWFPYRGMENPCLACVNTTLLDANSELMTIIARKVVHSWTGNLVTAASWEHRWMNEGFTVFLSRKICGSLYSEPYRHFLSMTGWTNDLKPVVEEFGPEHEFTKLVQDHTNVDPCKAYSYLSGEKGSAFLFYLEQKLGGPGKIYCPRHCR
uniref:Peptidase M1 membrane alanine aminopeptidase domain-containing protein n=1 Tax=Plectus sambesii TaxID=2011161 RepID=A0A914VA02_9BILA